MKTTLECNNRINKQVFLKHNKFVNLKKILSRGKCIHCELTLVHAAREGRIMLLFHAKMICRLTKGNFILEEKLQCLTTVFQTLSSTCYDCLPDVSINRKYTTDTSSTEKKQKPLQHLIGIKSLQYK